MTTTVKKGARLTGDDRTRMTKTVTSLYREGKSIRDISAATGRSYGFVHRVLSESDLVLRGRGGATRRRTA
ncbi:helix-turn-helix domain-containing protein [Angustibacter luteus]|jgi:transposase|uniref:Helix-turn-helix domain-containing protein n=1 Tax=Angustibacter luteus TaxID=658456 RepID=A0ABW1J9Z8_9ACTN